MQINSKHTSIGELKDLVEQDRQEHQLKTIAELFLQAANDWPTFDQTEISDFVNELKKYFGDPLTKENISTKAVSINDHNAWRHEAGNSIVEMMSLAERSYRESNLEKIVIKIVDYYS